MLIILYVDDIILANSNEYYLEKLLLNKFKKWHLKYFLSLGILKQNQKLSTLFKLELESDSNKKQPIKELIGMFDVFDVRFMSRQKCCCEFL